MRILYLHQQYSAPAGSIGTRSHALAAALAAAGHDVTARLRGTYPGAESGLAGPFRNGRREGRSPAGFRIVQSAAAGGSAAPLLARAAAFARFAAATTPSPSAAGTESSPPPRR